MPCYREYKASRVACAIVYQARKEEIEAIVMRESSGSAVFDDNSLYWCVELVEITGYEEHQLIEIAKKIKNGGRLTYTPSAKKNARRNKENLSVKLSPSGIIQSN